MLLTGEYDTYSISTIIYDVNRMTCKILHSTAMFAVGCNTVESE